MKSVKNKWNFVFKFGPKELKNHYHLIFHTKCKGGKTLEKVSSRHVHTVILCIIKQNKIK